MIDVNIIHTPTDWVSITATFFAAFFGALSAFILNAVYENRKEHDKRITAINSALNSVIANLTALLDSKKQFLISYNIELNELLEFSINYNESHSVLQDREFDEILRSLEISILEGNPFGNALKRWDEWGLIDLKIHEALGFFADTSPDDLRIFTNTELSTNEVTRLLKERNITRQIFDSEIQNFPKLDRKIIRAIYELLSVRETILEIVDRSLVFLKETYDRIHFYRKTHYENASTIQKWLLPKRKFLRGHFAKEALNLIPNKSRYAHLIDSLEGLEPL